jgi:hypothetical protein
LRPFYFAVNTPLDLLKRLLIYFVPGWQSTRRIDLEFAISQTVQAGTHWLVAAPQ